jgi:predicted enzyme related to lactoylglutathione lyase
MRNTLNWFEIFVADMKRAQSFYEGMLDTKLKLETFNAEPTAIFSDDGSAGSLVQRANRKPSTEGSLVYLNCNGTLDACLSRATQFGGSVVMPKTDIGPPGFIAIVSDTEGNAVGLHSERV